MLKVLIVDDNDLIRKSLIKRLDWQGLGLVCVGEAADGQAAYEQIEALSPSIVITDVKMPIADGFYTIDRCQANHPEVQFIIISGYDDFPYVKKAVQRDVVDYILKPIDTGELTETLQKAAGRVRQYRSRRQEARQTQEVRRHYQEQRVDHLLQSFLTYKIDFMDLQEQLDAADYPFRNPFCACLCLNLCAPHADGVRTLTPAQIDGMETRMEAQYLHSTCKLLHVYKNIYVVICTYPTQAHLSNRIIHQMYAAAAEGLAPAPQERLYLSYSAVMASDQLLTAYQQCLGQMLRRFAAPHEAILDDADAGVQAAVRPAPPHEKLEIALTLGMRDACKTIIRQIIRRAAAEPALLETCLPQVLLMLDRKCGDRLAIREFDRSVQKFYLLRFYDLAQVEETLCGLVDSLPQPAQEDVGDQVIAYIGAHFTQQLTLHALGELFHINPIYLGQLVKKKTGMLFNAYLNRLRVEKAKELIRTDPTLRLKDLSYSLGFMDSHYFTKVFKQHVGVTPTEYREQAGQTGVS